MSSYCDISARCCRVFSYTHRLRRRFFKSTTVSETILLHRTSGGSHAVALHLVASAPQRLLFALFPAVASSLTARTLLRRVRRQESKSQRDDETQHRRVVIPPLRPPAQVVAHAEVAYRTFLMHVLRLANVGRITTTLRENCPDHRHPPVTASQTEREIFCTHIFIAVKSQPII
jgi:hypothetical protein